MSDRKWSWVAPLVGAVVGVAIFVGVNVATGRAILPTVPGGASVSELSTAAVDGSAAPPGGPAAAGGQAVYMARCGACHQAAGQGIPYAFPPLAGSHWMTGDPETPIRIVLLGLSGEIEVNGSKFNLVMPPPEGLTDDAEIAEAISYARTSFGNQASPVDVELVKQVRASLGGRTTPWTAAELSALRVGGDADSAADAAGAGSAGAKVGGATVAPAE